MNRSEKPKYYRLVTVHLDEIGNEVYFKMSDESDGTRRLLDLIPAFCAALESDMQQTFVIDEIDRSLYSLLTIRLFESFHQRCGNGINDQIIATTHDFELLTQKLFRRDEMWFFERENDQTNLISFQISWTQKRFRYQKSYLNGRWVVC